MVKVFRIKKCRPYDSIFFLSCTKLCHGKIEHGSIVWKVLLIIMLCSDNFMNNDLLFGRNVFKDLGSDNIVLLLTTKYDKYCDKNNDTRNTIKKEKLEHKGKMHIIKSIKICLQSSLSGILTRLKCWQDLGILEQLAASSEGIGTKEILSQEQFLTSCFEWQAND